MDDASNRQYPSGYMSELYEVPVAGGRVKQRLTTPAEAYLFLCWRKYDALPG
jgi:hypothetical protein